VAVLLLMAAGAVFFAFQLQERPAAAPAQRPIPSRAAAD
jgi:hypothetical protein